MAGLRLSFIDAHFQSPPGWPRLCALKRRTTLLSPIRWAQSSHALQRVSMGHACGFRSSAPTSKVLPAGHACARSSAALLCSLLAPKAHHVIKTQQDENTLFLGFQTRLSYFASKRQIARAFMAALGTKDPISTYSGTFDPSALRSEQCAFAPAGPSPSRVGASP